ncbi:histone-lysine N-methyltransferase SETDB2-like isoform X2 [Convolutriloba macropyga]|uniref:histone-lysine N-methyltransferase SETDB2-like isoform X2 n=1 Tax=Convolutriloba macropyga TaxID=536237 RepID=UPI003F51B237
MKSSFRSFLGVSPKKSFDLIENNTAAVVECKKSCEKNYEAVLAVNAEDANGSCFSTVPNTKLRLNPCVFYSKGSIADRSPTKSQHCFEGSLNCENTDDLQLNAADHQGSSRAVHYVDYQAVRNSPQEDVPRDAFNLYETAGYAFNDLSQLLAASNSIRFDNSAPQMLQKDSIYTENIAPVFDSTMKATERTPSCLSNNVVFQWTPTTENLLSQNAMLCSEPTASATISQETNDQNANSLQRYQSIDVNISEGSTHSVSGDCHPIVAHVQSLTEPTVFNSVSKTMREEEQNHLADKEKMKCKKMAKLAQEPRALIEIDSLVNDVSEPIRELTSDERILLKQEFYLPVSEGMDPNDPICIDSDSSSVEYIFSKSAENYQSQPLKNWVQEQKKNLKGVDSDTDDVVEIAPKRNSYSSEDNARRHKCSRGCMTAVKFDRKLLEKEQILHRMFDVVRYLCSVRQPQLKPEMFTFCPNVSTNLQTDSISYPSHPLILDISKGNERMPVPVVNNVDDDCDFFVGYRYVTSREYEPVAARNIGVTHDADPSSAINVVVWCSCSDLCVKTSTCECRKLTESSTVTLRNPNGFPEAGYAYGRLNFQWPTGVFECNPKCICGPMCGNRVSQHGITVPMQVFKTRNMGWGVMVTEDVPKGAFLANYIGTVVDPTGDDENLIGRNTLHHLDLDLLEVVDREEGLRNKVPRSIQPKAKSTDRHGNKAHEHQQQQQTAHAENALPAADGAEVENKVPFVKPKIEYIESHETTKLKDTSGGIDVVSKSNTDVGTQQLTKVAADSKETSDKVADNAREEDENDDDDVFEKSTLNAAANAVIGTVDGSGLDDNEDLESELSPFLSTREQLHGRRHPFFVDSFQAGNFSRFFNHSCEPTMFAQNVFTTSHDPQIHQIAFFAFDDLKAGTELTYDYCVQCDDNTPTQIVCRCGAQTCRGRLL